MQTRKRFLAPRFLERFDEWLLLHKPETWTARTHLVAFYGGGFLILLALLCYVFPDDPRSESGAGNWTLFTSVITIIGLVVWLIYLMRFNVFKRYGHTSAFGRLRMFLLYFTAAGIIILIPFIQTMVESGKANAAFGDDEVVRDLNKINTMIVQLEYDSLNHRWQRDTVRVVDSIPGRQRRRDRRAGEVDLDYTTTTTKVGPGHLTVIDTADLRIRKEYADSSERINDSTWVFLQSPQYTFVNTYQLDQFAAADRFENVDIYRHTVRDFRRVNPEAVAASLLPLLDKYRDPDNDLLIEYTEPGPYDHIRSIHRRYQLDDVSEGLHHVVGRKNTWRGNGFSFMFRVFIYLTLLVTLLVFIFRHSTVRTFFLALLSACLLSMLTALFLALTNSPVPGMFGMLLFYFVVFAVISFTTWQLKTRRIIVGIAINLFVLILPFVPLILVAGYYSILDQANDHRVPDEFREFWYLLAEVTGIVMLLILVPLYIHRVYRRWYALPED